MATIQTDEDFYNEAQEKVCKALIGEYGNTED